MILLLFTGMALKAWKNYTKKFLEQYQYDEDLKLKMVKDENAFQINYLDVENTS